VVCFLCYDTKHLGKITREEYFILINKAFNNVAYRHVVHELFDLIDSDGDGLITID
jgi:Ca2+-binding EF-hand superfamily protein